MRKYEIDKMTIINSLSDTENKWMNATGNTNDSKYKNVNATVFKKILYDDKIPVAYTELTDSGKLGLAKGDLNLSFAVHSEYRNKGYAKKLLKEAIGWFKKSKYETISYIVNKNNKPSKSLAIKSGFVHFDAYDNGDWEYYAITNPKLLKEAYFGDRINKTLNQEVTVMEKSNLNSILLNQKIVEFNKWMNDKVVYGKLVNGTRITNPDNYDDYVTISPKDLYKYKVGVCWDYVEYESKVFKEKFHMKQVTSKPKLGEFALYYMQHSDRDGDMPTHTWLAYNLDDKFRIFESSWYANRGIHTFNNENEMISYYLSKQEKFYESKGNPLFSPVIIRYSSRKKYGLNTEEYMKSIWNDGTRVKINRVDISQESYEPVMETASNFKIITINKSSVNKYKDKYFGIRHLRFSPEFPGYSGKMIIDKSNDEVVGFINIDKSRDLIQALEVNKKYQRQGIATELLKLAISMGARNLTVRSNNEAAKALYVKNGWKYDKSRNTEKMLWMTHESYEPTTEGILPKLELYHISENGKMDGTTLTPKVPKNFLTMNGYEDDTTKRVCFCSSIKHCLRALSQNCTGKTFYVYKPIGLSKNDVYKPSLKEVPDSKVTGEYWVTKPVKIQLIGKIKVTGSTGPEIKYKYGNKTAELYDWDYENIDESTEIPKKDFKLTHEFYMQSILDRVIHRK